MIPLGNATIPGILLLQNPLSPAVQMILSFKTFIFYLPLSPYKSRKNMARPSAESHFFCVDHTEVHAVYYELYVEMQTSSIRGRNFILQMNVE